MSANLASKVFLEVGIGDMGSKSVNIDFVHNIHQKKFDPLVTQLK